MKLKKSQMTKEKLKQSQITEYCLYLLKHEGGENGRGMYKKGRDHFTQRNWTEYIPNRWSLPECQLLLISMKTLKSKGFFSSIEFLIHKKSKIFFVN
jgi:hypothetical protein